MYQVVAIGHPTARLKLTVLPTKHEAQKYASEHSHPDIEVVNEKTQLLVGRTVKGEWIEQLKPARRDLA